MQPLERQVVLRAQEVLLRHLCGRSPAPNEQLTGTLRGVQVVRSNEQQGILAVVVQLPLQNPGCELRVPAAPGRANAAPPPPPAAPFLPAAPITVREHKGEM